jgi:hypothetical protein
MTMNNSLETTRGVLETTPRRWESLVESVPEDLLLRSPLPGEWSAFDCLRHLLEAERDLLSVRLNHILDGRAELVPYDPDAPRDPIPEQTTRDILAAFVALRRESVRTLASLTPDDLSQTIFHPEYRVDVSLGELLDLWAAHDLMHTVQAEEALMQAFIPGSSVWRPEFAEHDVDVRV